MDTEKTLAIIFGDFVNKVYVGLINTSLCLYSKGKYVYITFSIDDGVNIRYNVKDKLEGEMTHKSFIDIQTLGYVIEEVFVKEIMKDESNSNDIALGIVEDIIKNRDI